MTLSRHAAGSTLFMLVLGSLCVAENCQYWIQEESNAGGYTKMNLTGTVPFANSLSTEASCVVVTGGGIHHACMANSLPEPPLYKKTHTNTPCTPTPEHTRIHRPCRHGVERQPNYICEWRRLWGRKDDAVPKWHAITRANGVERLLEQHILHARLVEISRGTSNGPQD